MKYKSYLIAILWGIQFCFTLPVSAQNTIQQQKDSLRRAIETEVVQQTILFIYV